MTMLQIFLSVIAAIEVDKLIWRAINKRIEKKIVRAIEIPSGASAQDIERIIKKDIADMLSERKNHDQ